MSVTFALAEEVEEEEVEREEGEDAEEVEERGLETVGEEKPERSCGGDSRAAQAEERGERRQCSALWTTATASAAQQGNAREGRLSWAGNSQHRRPPLLSSGLDGAQRSHCCGCAGGVAGMAGEAAPDALRGEVAPEELRGEMAPSTFSLLRRLR